MDSLRIMTYNVKGLSIDSDGVGRILRESNADVVAIQEPPLWWWGIRRFRRFAQAHGYKAVTGRGLARTTALLVKYSLSDDVRHVQSVPLSSRVRRLRLGWPTPRGYSRLTIRGITIFNVHLSLFARERGRHVARLVDAIEQVSSARCVLMGDLNETPDGPGWKAFCPPLRDAAEHLDAPTFPAVQPTRRIDAILVGDAITVKQLHTLTTADARTASDHLPLTATVTLDARGGSTE